MATDPPVAAAAVAAGPAAHRPAANRQRDFVCDENGLPMADAAGGLPELEHGLRNILEVEERRRLAKIHDRLREKTRKAAGKKSTPTAAIIDSQSIRTAEGGEARGFDSAKKITGRKRHIAVDTLGLVLAVVAHGADLQDQDGAKLVLEKLGNSTAA